jgi:hypothetical protein
MARRQDGQLVRIYRVEGAGIAIDESVRERGEDEWRLTGGGRDGIHGAPRADAAKSDYAETRLPPTRPERRESEANEVTRRS